MNVFLIAAISVDGFIACEADQISTSWTSKEDKKFFSERTKKAKAVVMGSATYQTVGRPLPDRVNIVYSRSSKAEEEEKGVRYTQLEPAALIEELEKEGFEEVAICGGSSIYTMFLKAGVITKLYLTIEPVAFGQGIPLFSDHLNLRLHLVELTKLSDQTLLLEYDVLKDQKAEC